MSTETKSETVATPELDRWKKQEGEGPWDDLDAAYRRDLAAATEKMRAELDDTQKVLSRFRQEELATQRAQADLCVYLNAKQFPEHYPTSWTDGVPDIALAVLKRLEQENEKLRKDRDELCAKLGRLDRFSTSCEYMGMEFDSDGEFVRYDDVCEMLKGVK